jgi:hypothetical protein
VSDQPNPDAWGQGKLTRAISLWQGEVGDAIREMTPAVLPGADATAIVGFCMNGALTENTTDSNPDQPFHEIGLLGTEAGPRSGPAPNPSPLAPDNSWGRLHDHPLVIQLLGRSATMRPDAWKTAPRDQVAVGLVNLRSHALGALAGMDDLRPVQLGSLWGIATAFMAWSAGSGATGSRYHAHHTELAAAPESERWAAFVKIASEQKPGPHGHGNIAYSALRTMQKLAAGRLLAEHGGHDVAWYGAIDPAIVDTITRHANDRP